MMLPARARKPLSQLQGQTDERRLVAREAGGEAARVRDLVVVMRMVVDRGVKRLMGTAPPKQQLTPPSKAATARQRRGAKIALLAKRQADEVFNVPLCLFFAPFVCL